MMKDTVRPNDPICGLTVDALHAQRDGKTFYFAALVAIGIISGGLLERANTVRR
ncbi:MAG: hypothetical protein ABI604_17045 [Nitrospirota bacterium]